MVLEYGAIAVEFSVADTSGLTPTTFKITKTEPNNLLDSIYHELAYLESYSEKC